MKNGADPIIGKTITAVVRAASGMAPHNQLFLVFSDNNSFEIWGEEIRCASRVDQQALPEVLKHLVAKKALIEVYPSAKDGET